MFLKSSRKLMFLVFVLSLLGCSTDSSNSLEKFAQRYKKVAEYYEERVRDDSGNLKLKMQLAGFYYDFRDYLKIKELLWDVDSGEARVILAKALVKLKEYDYAIEIFEQLKPMPEDPEYVYLYGEVLEEKNLFPKAVKIYSKVKPPFDKFAKDRLGFIKANIEYNIPSETLDFLKKAEAFIEQIEDEAAVFILVEEDMEGNSDNTSVSTIHVIEKILKERGKSLAEIQVNYDSTYERVDLEFARTITEDGKLIYAGGENIRDVSRYLNYPLYSNSRVRIVSMPSIDVGSFIEYKIKVYSSKLVAEDKVSFIYRLRERYPIFKADFSLKIPQDKEARFKLFNQEYAENIVLAPSLTEKEGKKIYTWTFDKIKSIIPEYGMPPSSLVNPAILISSFSSWDQIYEWWSSMCRDKIELTQEIRGFLEDIIKEARGDLDKAKKIYEFVAKNIRYVAIEYGEGGHEPHHAEEVFVNRYGDCKDQVILLAAMLRAAGIKAYPVLIPTREAYSIDKNFPSLGFNHAICVMESGDDLIFMDPTAETTPFLSIPIFVQDREALVFMEDDWLITRTPQIKDNSVKYDMAVTINGQENAAITRSVITKGHFASAYRGYLRYTHPAIIEEDIQKKMTEISSSSSLLNYNIENIDKLDLSLILTYEFIADKFLNPAGELRIVPALDQVYLDHNLISKEKRLYPIDFEGMYTKAAEIKIKLPENLKVKYLPSSQVLESQ